jgi:hypothetical protein
MKTIKLRFWTALVLISAITGLHSSHEQEMAACVLEMAQPINSAVQAVSDSAAAGGRGFASFLPGSFK